MRQRRLKAPASYPVALDHCMSRVVNRDFVFSPQERDQFVRLLRECERFCGVRVLTYCILSNHFHLLVEVPARPTQPLGPESERRRPGYAGIGCGPRTVRAEGPAEAGLWVRGGVAMAERCTCLRTAAAGSAGVWRA